MTLHRTVEKFSLLVRANHDHNIHGRTNKLNNLLSTAVDEKANQVLDKADAQVFHSIMANKCVRLKHEEVMRKADIISTPMKRLWVGESSLISTDEIEADEGTTFTAELPTRKKR